MADGRVLIPAFNNHDQSVRWARMFTVDQLKALWDTYEEWVESDPRFYALNGIHMVMNERGEGSYVAV